MLESDFLQADIKVRNHPDFVELSTMVRALSRWRHCMPHHQTLLSPLLRLKPEESRKHCQTESIWFVKLEGQQKECPPQVRHSDGDDAE